MATADERVQIIPAGTVLNNGLRKLGTDYANGGGVNRSARFYLKVLYGATLPTARLNVATLWVLPGDGDVSTENFPEGGDGTGGTADVDPQNDLAVVQFQSVNPSSATHEILEGWGELGKDGNRFVLKNNAEAGVDFADVELWMKTES